MTDTNRVTLKGSKRDMLSGARLIGKVDSRQIIEISVVLNHRRSMPANLEGTAVLSHADFAATYGADPADIRSMQQFAMEYNLNILERGDEIPRRTITMAGTAANMERAFSVELNEYSHPDGSYCGRAGTIQIPQEYASCIQSVFGLDDRTVAKPHLRYRSVSGEFGVRSPNTSYTPVQVAHLYDFPKDVTGFGQTIGLIELGGGYRPSDIQEYFNSLGLEAPAMRTVSVDHARNRPTTPQSVDGEVLLDIEVAGTTAPGAAICVYFAPNTSRGFQDALSMAVHDQVNKPSVISISWGSAEINWTEQSMAAFDLVAQEACMLGVTITVAAGDAGSRDNVADGLNHVDFPASSPHVLATGGTRLTSGWGTITNETVWNDGALGGATGGGYSTYFARPEWQSNLTAQNNRGVPDVAGNADPETGYYILVDGQKMVVGGTSAVAPLWAGLITLMNEKLGYRLGFVNPHLYSIKQTDGFHDITVGNNGTFPAEIGWDAATGLGSPNGVGLCHALQATVATNRTSATSGAVQSSQALRRT
jgi:kumamolisin